MTTSRILLLCSFLLLSACNPFVVFRADSEKLVTSGWAKQPKDQKDPPTLYCYKTLAAPVCYSSPKPDLHSKMVGYYGPKP